MKNRMKEEVRQTEEKWKNVGELLAVGLSILQLVSIVVERATWKGGEASN